MRKPARYLIQPTDYLSSIPDALQLPEGRVLVHNAVRPRRTPTGGFRFWSQPEDDSLEECSCNFAGLNANGELPHYRKRRMARRTT